MGRYLLLGLMVGILGASMALGELGTMPAAAPAGGSFPAANPTPDPRDAQRAKFEQTLAEREYWVNERGDRLQAPNRRHALRSYFEPTGVAVHDRMAQGTAPLVALRLARLGRDDRLTPTPPGQVRYERGRVEIDRPGLGLVEWFENSEAGLEQGFTLSNRPATLARAGASMPEPSSAELVLELSVESAIATLRGDTIHLATGAGRTLSYGKLHVVDADGDELAARFEVPAPDRLRLVVDDGEATYPIVVDPLLTGTADSQLESDRNTARLGASVASAGDVNGDGYDDLIVGSRGTNMPNVYIYHGGPNGVGTGGPAVADTVLTSPDISSNFGSAVASAGDVNGDGYDDVIVGHYSRFDPTQGFSEGAAYIYLGAPGGIPNGSEATANARLESNQSASQFGIYLASAGDVNGDGYGDVVVGAWRYDNGTVDEGAAFVFLGSASGIANGNPTTASAVLESDQAGLVGPPSSITGLGCCLGSAGDVNGDGYGDLILGAPGYAFGSASLGAAFVHLGSATGIASGSPATAHAQIDGVSGDYLFGLSAASAGDVNGDGFDDIVVGTSRAASTSRPTASVHLGSATGITSGSRLTANATLSWDPPAAPAVYNVSAGSAGDVNRDGFADVILAASLAFAGPIPQTGAAFVFLGSASGVAGGAPADAPIRISLGSGVIGNILVEVAAAAGDVNGDGFADQIVGVPAANRASVVLGNSKGRPVLARQLRGDGSGLPVQPGANVVSSDSFVAELTTRSAFGRERAKLEVEVCPLGSPFGDVDCLHRTSAAWIDLGTSGAVLSETVTGLTPSTLYSWRGRMLTADYASTQPGVVPVVKRGPWARVQARASMGDFRTSVPEPALAVGLAAGVVLLSALRAVHRRGDSH